MPAAPPSTASRTLSVSSCRTIRPRPAPIAERMLISLSRVADCASSRFARFTHAIRSTRPTTPIITLPARTSWPRPLMPSAASDSSAISSVRPSLAAGNCFSSAAAIVFIAASACLTGTPGFSRPIMLIQRNRRLDISVRSCPFASCSRMLSGTQTRSGPASEKVPLKPGGVMPMTVNGRPFSVSVWPIRFGSDPNSLIHKLWLTTATVSAPSERSSSGLNSRPRNGLMPSTSK